MKLALTTLSLACAFWAGNAMAHQRPDVTSCLLIAMVWSALVAALG